MSDSGFYSPGTSVLHGAHGATKIVAFVLVVPMAPFIVHNLHSLVVLACALALLLLIGRIAVRQVALFAPALAIAAFAALSWLLFADAGGEVVLQIDAGPVEYVLRAGTLDRAATAASQVVVWALSYILLLTTTRSRDLVAGLVRLRVPTSFSRALAMALRYWSTVSADARQVADAQRARGVDLDGHGRLRNLLHTVSATAVPTLFLMLKRFQTLNYALVLRGFGARGPKTRLYNPSFSSSDVVLVALVAAMLLIVLLADMEILIP